MKMKVFILIFLVTLTGLSQVNLFPFIASRIEGNVVDRDTGMPIVDAQAYLLYDEDYLFKAYSQLKQHLKFEWDKKTDKNGFFRFDNLPKGEYYVCIYREGYEYYGPIRKVPDYVHKDSLERDPDIRFISRNIKGRIYLKEGEIKHLKIKLAKEAVLEINFTRKTPKGTEPLASSYLPKFNHPSVLTNFGANLKLKDVEPLFEVNPSKKEIGRVVFGNLPGGETVKVYAWAEGYPNAYYDVILESGKKKVVNHVLDYTVGPVVHGILKDKLTGKPHSNAYVCIVKLRKGVCAYSDYNGEFWLGGFMPGENKLYISLKNGKQDTLTLNVKTDEILELNLKY
jgi:hypothetical protein